MLKQLEECPYIVNIIDVLPLHSKNENQTNNLVYLFNMTNDS